MSLKSPQPVGDPTLSQAQVKAYFGQKRAFTLGPLEVQYLRAENHELSLIDVRSTVDYEKAHAPHAIHLPEERWEDQRELSKKTVSVFMGYSGLCPLAARAAVRFGEQGYPVMEMEGGFEAWQDHQLDVVSGKGRKAA